MGDDHGSAVHPDTRIGHMHLKVADLERAVRFYNGILGFEVMERWGDQAAFLSAGGYHHHIALNTWQSRGGSPPPAGTTGLYHLAILYPTRAALADALRRLLKAGVALDGASDHGVSEALYLRDPDGNGVELYRDRPPEQWPRTHDGRLAMTNTPLDLQSLLANKTERDANDHGPLGLNRGTLDSSVRQGLNAPRGCAGLQTSLGRPMEWASTKPATASNRSRPV